MRIGEAGGAGHDVPSNRRSLSLDVNNKQRIVQSSMQETNDKCAGQVSQIQASSESIIGFSIFWLLSHESTAYKVSHLVIFSVYRNTAPRCSRRGPFDRAEARRKRRKNLH